MANIPIQFRQERLNRWFDKLTFPRIFLIWLGVVTLFGILYFFFSDDTNVLHYVTEGGEVSLLDSIYFSFVTATTTGFGDITPMGYFKVIAIFEVVIGLLLLAFVTSKLVSIKQDMVLNEIYELSLNENIDRLRSSLLLFRQNLSRVQNKVESKTILLREQGEIHLYFNQLKHALNEIMLLFREGQHAFAKRADPVSSEVLFNSVNMSFEKIDELLIFLQENEIAWKSEQGTKTINACIKVADNLFDRIKTASYLSSKSIEEVCMHKNRIIKKLKKQLNSDTKKV